MQAFWDCSSLTSIRLPGKITGIEMGMFENCNCLVNVNIPDNVASIGKDVFYGCSSLSDISLPEGVGSIGEQAFYGCSSLTAISIPEGVGSIGKQAFYDCSSLTDISLPESVTDIGAHAFVGTPWMAGRQKENPVVSVNRIVIDGSLVNGAVTIPEGVTAIGEGAFSDCKDLTSISIPDGVVMVGEKAFSGCSSLNSISIPESVTDMREYIFQECPQSLVIRGYKDSYAESYAIQNGMNFESLGGSEPSQTVSPDTKRGDANLNGYIDLEDVQYIFRIALGIWDKPDVNGFYAADANGDECIDFSDALYVLKLTAGIAELPNGYEIKADTDIPTPEAVVTTLAGGTISFDICVKNADVSKLDYKIMYDKDVLQLTKQPELAAGYLVAANPGMGKSINTMMNTDGEIRFAAVQEEQTIYSGSILHMEFKALPDKIFNVKVYRNSARPTDEIEVLLKDDGTTVEKKTDIIVNMDGSKTEIRTETNRKSDGSTIIKEIRENIAEVNGEIKRQAVIKDEKLDNTGRSVEKFEYDKASTSISK